MHWLLMLKRALKETIHGVSFVTVAKNARVVFTIEDIEVEVSWNGKFCLLRAVFPVLKALRYCDSDFPTIDKILMLPLTTHHLCLMTRSCLVLLINV